MTIVTFAIADRGDLEESDMPRETLRSLIGRSALAAALDRAIAARMSTNLRRGAYAGAELATGLRERLGADGREIHA